MWVILDVGVDRESFTDTLRQTIEDPDREWIVEASALDPDGDLVWVADNGTEGGMPVFHMMWADPSDLGPSYNVNGATADFRRKLVHAFITATAD